MATDDREPATVLVAIRVDLLRALLDLADRAATRDADDDTIDEARALLLPGTD